MLDFITQNLATIIIAALLAALVIFIIIRMIKKRKNSADCSACSISSGCAGCPIYTLQQSQAPSQDKEQESTDNT